MKKSRSPFYWIAAGFLAACLIGALGVTWYHGGYGDPVEPWAPKPAGSAIFPASRETDARAGAPADPVSTETGIPTPLKPTLQKPTEPPQPTHTPVPTPDNWVEDQLKQMTLAQKAGQVILTGVIGGDPTAENCATIHSLLPGGVAYNGANVKSLNDLQQLSAFLQKCMGDANGVPLLIALDHEGQFIDRFQTGATLFPTALGIGASLDPHNAFLVANTSGQELLFAGVNMVLGPDADVLTNPENSVISLRAYGSDPNQVSQYVNQAEQGYQKAGIIPVLKHFPGHGGVTADSHAVLPLDSSSLADMEKTQLVPFRNAISMGAEVVMVGHIAYPGVDPSGLPATLSKPLIDLLRTRLGFQGLAISDEMGMGAVTQTGQSVASAAVLALKSGLDMLIITNPAQALAARDMLVSSVQMGTFSPSRLDDAVRHVLTLKAAHGLRQLPLAAHPAPDWAADQQVSAAIGRSAVSMPVNTSGLVPLPAGLRRILIFGPTDDVVQTPNFYAALDSVLRARQIEPSIIKYAINSPGNKDYTASASTYDLVLFLTWDAHVNRDTWQSTSIKRLMSTGKPLIVVALKSPFDLLDFKGVSTYLATLGTTPGQVQQLADLLAGSSQSTGKLPVDLP